MVDEIKLFDFENQSFRVLQIENEPWFVGKDVAEILGYGDTNQAIRKHVEDDKLTRRIDGGCQKRNMTLINKAS